MLRPSQCFGELAPQADCIVDRPRRGDARVGHDERPLRIVMDYRPITEPVDERFAVRGVEHVVEGVLVAQPSNPVGARDQMQVVVAEHDMRPVAEIGDEPQYLQRARTPVDQIAHEPEPIAPGIEAALPEQRSQLRVAALHIPDGVRGHRRVSLGPETRAERTRSDSATRHRATHDCRRPATVAPRRYQCTTFGTDRLNAGICASKRWPSSASIW